MSTMPPPPTMPPAAPTGPSRAEILDKVKGPAIALMVIAILGILLNLFGLVANMLGMGMGAMGMQDMSQLEDAGMGWMAPLMSGTLSIVTGLVSLIGNAVIVFGAMKMKDLQSYGLAMTAAILAIVPCFTACCLIGIPLGIWALVVLMKPEVKAAFA
jgi:hypothetical protein